MADLELMDPIEVDVLRRENDRRKTGLLEIRRRLVEMPSVICGMGDVIDHALDSQRMPEIEMDWVETARTNAAEMDKDRMECAPADAALLRGLANEIERLNAWVDDLQSGMYVNCVYCGHRYGPGETTPVSMADALKVHISQCPEHPMSAMREALEAWNFCRSSLTVDDDDTEGANRLVMAAELTDHALGSNPTP